MIAKEKKELLRLRAENKELKVQIENHFRVYKETTWELVDLRIIIDLIESALRGEE